MVRIGGSPSPDVVGERIQLNGQTFTVVGVMPQAFAPPCFDGNARRKAWIPFESKRRSGVSDAGLSVVARVSPNEPLALVQARLDGYGMRRATERGVASYAGMFLERFGSEKARNARPGLLLQALAACLLLIACANAGSLFLLHASRRDTEFLTRAFVGAAPARIVRQLLLESTVIATIGGALGAGLSLLVGTAVRTLVDPILPRGVTYHVGFGVISRAECRPNTKTKSSATWTHPESSSAAGFHSIRSAMRGSTPAARRAGRNAAVSPETASTAKTPA